MKFVILAIVFAVALARPQDAPAAEGAAPHQNVTIITNTNENDGKGTYKINYELSDGTKFEQDGHTVPPMGDSTDSSLVIQGSYSYVGPDGKTYQITYTADQNGFQPKGDFLPTPPTDPNNPASGAAAPAAPAARR